MSAKNLDKHNRWRSRQVAFRLSPEEADLSGHLCKTLRADQAGLYHPASAGHGGGRSGQPQGVQSPAESDGGDSHAASADRSRCRPG